ncbi:MAG: hypothetical protein COY02_00835 [Parcubacteria group bacterium CG_4_10_14_0_2_um_filter_41_6]|nr:MAG: hypothetical protein COY02_00835 [Parcubacteria group bacterium CG_4_10_14_0_2_um_filter_41_6]
MHSGYFCDIIYLTMNYPTPTIGALSEISRDIAQILFATFVVGQIFIETKNTESILVGFIGSLVFWILGVYIVKERRKYDRI